MVAHLTKREEVLYRIEVHNTPETVAREDEASKIFGYEEDKNYE